MKQRDYERQLLLDHKVVRAITLFGAIEKNEHFERVPKIISNFGAQITFSPNLHNSSYIYTNATGKRRGGGITLGSRDIILNTALFFFIIIKIEMHFLYLIWHGKVNECVFKVKKIRVMWVDH